jgi:hypothetical protein
MSVAENKSLNVRWVESFNHHDWAAEAACRTLDYVAHRFGRPRSSRLCGLGWLPKDLQRGVP